MHMFIKGQKITCLSKKCPCYIVLTLIFILLVCSSLRFVTVLLKQCLVPNTSEIIKCHFNLDKDALPLAESVAFLSPPNPIIFHETSCDGKLNSRQACAVESAARAHPRRRIFVLFSGPIMEEALQSGALHILREFANIDFARVHLLEYCKGTPIEGMISSGVLNRSLFPVAHVSDILRILSLNKWGGIYLDLDVVVTKTFKSLPKNFAVRETPFVVSNGILALSNDQIGNQLTELILQEIARSFGSDSWSHNGPMAVTRVLQRWCGVDNAHEMSAMFCRGLEVYDSDAFYPISCLKSQLFVVPSVVTLDNVYTYHVCNENTRKYPVHNQSFYAKLAQMYCPAVYQLYGNDFGL